MAGTMPHAIFIEENADGSGGVAAYAAELPGCASFALTDQEAAAALPRRVDEFCAWLRHGGEDAPSFLGDNWYEVERHAATPGDDGRVRRAAFSLDELSPGDDEFARWLRWLELAREELAMALDEAGDAALADLLQRIAAQDRELARTLGAEAPDARSAADPIDALYEARDLLTEALAACGPTADGVRRAVRLGIADDLRTADLLRGTVA